MMIKTLAFSLLLLLVSSLALGADGGRVFSREAGISFVKPDAWDATSLELGGGDQRLDAARLEAELRRKGYVPLFVVTKHPEPFDGVNPSFQVSLRPLGQLKDRSPEEILQMIQQGLRASYKDLEVLQDVGPSRVDEIIGAEMTVAYLFKTPEGQDLASRARMICLLRDEMIIQIALGMPRNPDPGDEATLDSILESLEIKD